MKKFKVTASDITHYELEILAENEGNAWALARELDGGMFVPVGDGSWSIIDVVEIPAELKPEQIAFIDAYARGVGNYPKDVVKAFFLIDDSDEFSERYPLAYPSIMDAYSVWCSAVEYAKKQCLSKTEN